jgi:tRNA (guanine37-N1)-methyltransferase
VEDRVRTYNLDAREFVKKAVVEAWERPFQVYGPRQSVKERTKAERARRMAASSGAPASNHPPPPPPPPTAPKLKPKRIVDHFVMNLPGSAIDFLDAYRGLYVPLKDRPGFMEELGGEKVDNMPLIHCYCFTKDVENAEKDICQVGYRSLFSPCICNIVLTVTVFCSERQRHWDMRWSRGWRASVCRLCGQ